MGRWKGIECAQCRAPATVAWEWMAHAAGFGPWGSESILVMGRIQCAAGHWYDAELEVIQYAPEEEE